MFAISTRELIVDYILCLFPVFSLWYCIWTGWINAHGIKKILAKSIGIILMICCFILSTIGSIAAIMFSYEISDLKKTNLDGGLIIEESFHGMLDSGNKRITLKKPVLLIFEREVGSVKYFWDEKGYSADIIERDEGVYLDYYEGDSLIWFEQFYQYQQ